MARFPVGPGTPVHVPVDEDGTPLGDLLSGSTTNETRLDYVARTDGQPVYIGRAADGSATSAAVWNIERLTYDGNGRVTRKQVREDAVWDNRAILAW